MQQAPGPGWGSRGTFSGEGCPPPHTWPLTASPLLRETPGLGLVGLCPAHLVFTAATERLGPRPRRPQSHLGEGDLPITWARAGQVLAKVGFESDMSGSRSPALCTP